MKTLFLVKNENGFLKSIEFNKKALLQLPVYTDLKSEALVCFEHMTYVLRFNLHDFEFLKCERVAVSDDNNTTATHALYKESYAFDNFCNVTRKLSTINNLRKDLMKVQQPLIDFLKRGLFKSDGSVLKKHQAEYKAIADSVKSEIRFEVSSYDVIWVEVFRGGVQDGFQVLTGEREDQQVVKNYKNITVKQYNKALKDIEEKTKLSQTLKNQVSTIKEAFYL